MVRSLLHPDVRHVVDRDYTEFTEIQKLAIPVITKGENTLVIAPTGSGKTETALLPVFSAILKKKDEAKKKGEKLTGIRAIYITPLRALNRDIMNRIEKLCKELGITVGVRHGDTTASERQKQRDDPPVLLITTPETLQSLLIAPTLSDALVHVRHVIIDEVHELYESKRGVQLALGMERLNGKSPGFQRIGLSATIGQPEEVAKFLGKDTIICQTKQIRKIGLTVEYLNRPKGSEAAKLRSQLHLPSSTIARMQRIEELIHDHKSALIFVNTRYAAESIANGLYAIESLKHHVSVHHSSLSKEIRIETEKRFKEQAVKAIVCTSSLELGIDIGTIEAVVQYSSPRQVTRLLQRVGRSGHKHYLESKGIILPTDEVDLAESVAICQAAEKGELEKPEHFFNALDVLAHFITGMLVEYNKIQLERVYEIAKRTYSYNTLTLEDFKSTCIQLRNIGLITILEEPNGETFLQTKGTRTKLYYYENVSTIPDDKKFFIRDAATRKNVAVLDEAFVSEFIETGGTFIAQGKAWKVLSIDEREVVVEAAGLVTAAIPDWVGEEIPVTMETAQSVAQIISGEMDKANISNNTSNYYAKLGKEEQNTLETFRKKQSTSFLPGKQIVIEENVEDNSIVIHSFYGLRANETIGRVLAVLLSQRDKSLRTRSSPYSIVLQFSRPVGGEEVLNVLKKLNENTVEHVLKTTLPATRLFRHKFIHVGKRFGFISKKWEASTASIGRIIGAIPLSNPMMKETFSELFHSRLSIEEAGVVANGIANKTIPIKHIFSKQWSPLGKNAVDLGGMSELMIPSEPTEAVLESFANTLKEKTVAMYCTFCKNNSTILLSELKLTDALKCPHCASSQLTLAQYNDKEHKLEAAKATALISAYGAKALYALETYGVGPQTAGRVLSRLHKTDSEFYSDLLESQKSFIKNRKFWKI